LGSESKKKGVYPQLGAPCGGLVAQWHPLALLGSPTSCFVSISWKALGQGVGAGGVGLVLVLRRIG
jgi:hypothetical protein